MTTPNKSEALPPATGSAISEWEMAVITDCLHGSLRLCDRTALWKFNETQRLDVLNRLYVRMDRVPSNLQNAP